MLDPLTALSVASSVVQFIEFTLTLLKDAKGIKQHGSSAAMSKETLLVKDLVNHCATLHARKPPRVSDFDSFKEEEQV